MAEDKKAAKENRQKKQGKKPEEEEAAAGKKSGESKKKMQGSNTLEDPYKIVLNPLSTEKSIKLMDTENKLIFVVSKRSKKQEIKRSIEKMYKVKVVKINTLVTSKGQKRAYVKFSPETPAIDIATNLGLM